MALIDDIGVVLKQTEDTLVTARYGYSDLIGDDQARRMVGLRNFVVFGRSVSYALQNLRGVVGKTEFDEWYLPKQEAMSKDPVCKHMNSVRNEILKEGKLGVAGFGHLKSFSTDDLARFPKPGGAEAFFMFDATGGSGWTVRLPDGSTEPYYVELPGDIGSWKQYFVGFDDKKFGEVGVRSVEEVAKHYLDILEGLVADAKRHFLANAAPHPDESTVRTAGPAGRPHLRLVK
ncbi:hypothetical protein KPA94_20545 [Burkholderia semiarida]|uniref:hypothetical protein n=1 Tax=Burkholderia semiarida TaxID=2843303 RepID=UPI0023DDFF98|nr:hypothetical protein [Burkholderia semiarida]MDF3115819.1 hypothetical protein [Burkholderia semiarida]